jgi:amino acid permease
MVTHLTTGFAITINVFTSIFAYLTFLQETEDNFLKNYPEKNGEFIPIALRIIFVLNMIVTYPTSFQVVRHTLYAARNRFVDTNAQQDAKNSPVQWHVLITLLLFMSSVITVCFVDKLGIVMSITGSICCNSLAFVLPCLCYLTSYDYSKITKHQIFIYIIPNCLIIIASVALGIMDLYYTATCV